MRRERLPIALGLPLGLLLAASCEKCPVGCAEGKPQTVYEGPWLIIPWERVGPCAFRLTIEELPGSYPSPPDLGNGFYSVYVNRGPVRRGWVTLDEPTRTFVVRDDICKGRVESFEVHFQTVLRTVHE